MSTGTYEKMPDERPHPCHEQNAGGTPVAWIVYEEAYGFSINCTDAYGEGTIVDITFCPWCGLRLQLPEHDRKLSRSGQRNRRSIKQVD